MKRAALTVLAIVAGYWEFAGDLHYSLPAFGTVCDGQVVGQSVILGVLALIVFGSVILNWIFDSVQCRTVVPYFCPVSFLKSLDSLGTFCDVVNQN